MPPNVYGQLPKLEVNDEIVNDDAEYRLQTAIVDASRAAYREQQGSNLQRKLDSVEDRVLKPTDSAYVATASTFYGSNSSSLATTALVVASTVDIKSIENGVKTFAESSKILMKTLDGISQVHPFIAVAVLAFKAVITLELKRRDNDQKIIAVKLKMSDLMSALLELRNIKDPTHTAPDGTNIQGRMQSLMEQIARDVTACGNACDTYAKKHIVVKVLKSPIWESRLGDFMTLFEQHRSAIEFSLSIHTSLGVESANRVLANVQQNVQSVDEKLNMLLLFRALDSPHEKELMKIVAARGGSNACLDNEAVLKELVVLRRGKPTSSTKFGSDLFALTQVRKEMKEDIDESLEKNMELFGRKLDVQKRQLVKELEDVVHRESDRVISAVVSGPHDRVIDLDLHAIWRDMGWKGSVKAKNFVLALHDHFQEKYAGIQDPNCGDHVEPPSSAPSDTTSDIASDLGVSQKGDDMWALTYINILRVQSILEAFDDDGTGFISVKEANMFSSSRPHNWSLTDWLAYWAAGWHSSVWDYRRKIKSITDEMFRMLDDVLPVNRSLVNRYLGSQHAFVRVELLLQSVSPYDGQGDNNNLHEKIRLYVTEEEERLRSTLESTAWDIDAMDTLSLITGPGRIEKFIFPLLYLILHRHLQIIRLACTEVLADFELDHASNALWLILCAADERIARLSAVFRHNNLDVSAQLGNVAFGMFKLLHDPTLADYSDQDAEFIPDYVDNSQTDPSILKFGAQGDEYDRAAYEVTDPEPTTVHLDVSSIGLSIMKGIWTGLYFYQGSDRTDGLMQINIHSSADSGSFQGGGNDGLDTFTVSGHIKYSTETEMDVRFVKDYTRLQYGEKVSWIYHGILDTVTGTISGEWGNEEAGDLGTFRLGRASAWTHQFRYSPSDFEENAALARWSFAGASALYEAKRRLWAWSFFKDRRTRRKRFLELHQRRELTSSYYLSPEYRLSADEDAELNALEQCLTPADARLYHAMGRSELRRLCIHFNTCCDTCSSTMVGPRILCLLCVSENLRDQVDLCSNCIKTTIQTRGFTHEPWHDVVQVRRVVHNRAKGSLVISGKEAVELGKSLFGRSQRLEDGNDVPDPIWRCSCCDDIISMPCWFCVTCADETFICDGCNVENAPCVNAEHVDAHPLVRLNRSAAAEANAIDGRLQTIETRLVEKWTVMTERLCHLEQRFEHHENAVHDRLTALESKVEQRLTTVESLLIRLASKFEA